MAVLGFVGLVCLAPAAYGYLGRVWHRRGGMVGEGGSVYQLAWPLFMRSAAYLLAIGAVLLVTAGAWGLAS